MHIQGVWFSALFCYYSATHSMSLTESDSFKSLKECARNIDKKIAKVERELLCPSLFADPLKSASSEEFVEHRIEEVINVKEHIKKLIEETRHSLEVQKKFNEQLSTKKNSLIQQLMEIESHLQKYGYKPSGKDYGNLLPHKEEEEGEEEEEESCNDSKKIADGSRMPSEDVTTKDFEDSNQSYKECLTPYVSVAQSRSNSLVSSKQHYIPRKLVDDDGTEPKSACDQATVNNINQTPGYSETFYELERKFKMHRKLQKGNESAF